MSTIRSLARCWFCFVCMLICACQNNQPQAPTGGTGKSEQAAGVQASESTGGEASREGGAPATKFAGDEPNYVDSGTAKAPGMPPPRAEPTSDPNRTKAESPPADADVEPPPSTEKPDFDEEQFTTPLPKIDDAWQRLHPTQELWIDVDKKQVIVGGWICLRAGLLEMFACPRNTKEHESVVAVRARPELVHAALLALDIEPGRPARFDPEYAPAEGPKIEIMVRFIRDGQIEEVRSQEMVRYLRDKKILDYPWVFAGSQFVEDPENKRRFYAANLGSFVCVSNFPDATFDIPTRSSEEFSFLMFEANTEKIPPLGTRVLLLFSRGADE